MIWNEDAWRFLTIAFCDAAESWQLGFQDAATPIMQGIIDLHHDIFFFLILILVFVLWMLVRALWGLLIFVILKMNRATSHSTSASSSSSSSANDKKRRRDKEEDHMRTEVVNGVVDFITKYEKELMAEFPKAHPYFLSNTFFNKVTTELLENAGLMPEYHRTMRFLRQVHEILIEDLNVSEYKNNQIYSAISRLLSKR